MAKQLDLSNKPKPSNNLNLPIILLLILMVGMGYAIFHQMIDHQPINKYANSTTTKTPISSLGEESMKSGRFVLGSAMSDDNLYFIYFEGNTSIKLKKLDSKFVTLKMDENEYPYLETIEYTTCYEFNGNSNNYCEKSWFFLTEYTFHVPNGTIIHENYNMNGV
jgi:hypothetical protein